MIQEQKVELVITPAVKDLGIAVRMAVIRGATISNKSNVLERRKKEAVARLQEIEVKTDPVLRGYHSLYPPGEIYQDFIPPSEHLLNLAKRNGRLPNINTVVDCYNLISFQTGLSVGAHDLAHIQGDVIFKITDGSELYVPLGETSPQTVHSGEYVCMDAEKILCRLDVKQCDQTKITKTTQAFMVYVQGNSDTDAAYLDAGLNQICTLIMEICGGTCEFVGTANS